MFWRPHVHGMVPRKQQSINSTNSRSTLFPPSVYHYFNGITQWGHASFQSTRNGAGSWGSKGFLCMARFRYNTVDYRKPELSWYQLYCHRRLSLWEPAVTPVTTKLVSRRRLIFSAKARRFIQRDGRTMPKLWNHNITVTSQGAPWRLKSPASGLFAQLFVQMYTKENIKAPRHWPWWGESTGDRGFPSQRANNAENVYIWWRHHERQLMHISAPSMPITCNSSSPGAAYMRRRTGSVLVQIRACRLIGAKPLPAPMPSYCQLYP